MKTTAGIDVGTQSTKVLIYDYTNKQIVFTAQSAHELESRDDGTREQEASWWTTAIEQCFAEIPADIKSSVQAIGVSGQQHGFVPIDKEGKVLIPVKLWCDTSTAAECDEITNAFGGEKKLTAQLGNPILPGYTASKILWFKKNHPDHFKNMAYVLLPHDYINYWLTDSIVMEYGDASGTGLLNIKERTWHTELINKIDPSLLAKLPKLISAEISAGNLSETRAARLGLPAGIPVSSGGGDNMMAAIGTGTVQEGMLAMSLGTSGTLFGYSDTPVIDPEGKIAAFCSSTGGWLPLVCTMNCTVATELTRTMSKLSLKELEAHARTAPPGANGVIMLPFFNGERTPNLPNATGTILGLTADNYNIENISRASMESAIFGLQYGLDSFAALGFQPRGIRLTGGGAKNKLWQQMAADITGLPVTLPSVTESAAFGACLQALWCISNQSSPESAINQLSKIHVQFSDSEIQPDNNNHQLYKTIYKKYLSAVNALGSYFT